ncbi:MAG: prepilin-type N-terminal cleavage/methylation domain-containing protein [Ilumatobacteraceae bacterium]
MKSIRVEEGEAQSTSARRDAGFSLVEMVVTIALMGVAMVPIMMAAYVLVRTSSFNHNSSKVETVLNNAADRVNRAGGTCDYHEFMEAAALAQHWDADRVTWTYAWFEPGATATANGTWHTAATACPSTGYDKDLVQLVDITVTSPDGVVQRSLQVVKSRI